MPFLPRRTGRPSVGVGHRTWPYLADQESPCISSAGVVINEFPLLWWLIGTGGQSTPGTVASLSSHRKDLREKHVSRPEQRWSSARQVKNATSYCNTWDCAKCSPNRENLHLHVLCFGGRSPCPRKRTA